MYSNSYNVEINYMGINYVWINIGINLYNIERDFINWQLNRKMIQEHEKAIYRSTNLPSQKMFEFAIVGEIQIKVTTGHHFMISKPVKIENNYNIYY